MYIMYEDKCKSKFFAHIKWKIIKILIETWIIVKNNEVNKVGI